MVSRLRAARAVRFGLLVAAALSLCGSAGLHPEPASARPAARLAFAPPSPTGSSDGLGHTCNLCLVHGGMSVSTAETITNVALPRTPFAPTPELVPAPSCPLARHEGRAPPVAS